MKNEKDEVVMVLVKLEGNVSEASREVGMRSRPTTDAYRSGWDGLWGKKTEHTVN